MTSRHEIWAMLDRLQMDAREHVARIDTLRQLVAAIELPTAARPACPTCGIAFQLTWQRDEHVYTSHNGPVPEHYLAAERAAGLE